MNKEINFSITAVIYSSKESTWNVLLSGQLYQNVWGAKLKATWEPGTSIEFNGVWENVEYTDRGVVLARKENHFLRYSYWSSFWGAVDSPDEYCFIEYSINALDSFSCELTITQNGFRDEKHYSDTVALWKNTLDVIKSDSEKIDLSAHCNAVFNNLLFTFDSISEESYNKPVSKGWNIAQVVEHIILGNSGLRQFLTESSSDSLNPYDLNVQSIRSMMLNTTDKLRSLDILTPPFRKYNKEHHRDLLLKIQMEINDCVQTLDHRSKCGFEMAPFGIMSIFEWLNFSVYHISRHAKQIEAIRRTIL